MRLLIFLIVLSLSSCWRYSVLYEGNNSSSGTPPIDSLKYKTGDILTIKGNTGFLTKNGHYFMGWSISTDTNSAIYYPGDDFTVPAENTKFFARWERVTSTSDFIPNGVVATKGQLAGSIKISWNSITGISRYNVFRSDSINGSYNSVGFANTTHFYDNSTIPGKEYYYRVRSFYNGHYSSYSISRSGWSRLEKPIINYTSNGNYFDKIKISWDRVPGAIGYYIYRASANNGPFFLIGSSSNIDIFDKTAVSGTMYYYKIKAYRNNINTQYSNTSRGWSKLRPPMLNVSRGNHIDKIRITWDSIQGSTNYEIFRSETLENPYISIGQVSIPSKNDINVIPGKYYYYKVVAYGKNFQSDKSLSSRGWTKLEKPNINVTYGTLTDKIKITWQGIRNAKNYLVYRSQSDDCGYCLIGSTVDTLYEDNTATPGVEYFYKIKARYDQIYSDFSNIEKGLRVKLL